MEYGRHKSYGDGDVDWSSKGKDTKDNQLKLMAGGDGNAGAGVDTAVAH